MGSVIEVSGLSMGYTGRCVLRDVSFTAESSEFIGVLGRNGAGKSTLLKTLMGILPKQAGTIKYLGRDLKSFKDKEFARIVAYLQQHVEVGFGYTGEDIVLAGRYPYMKWWEKESDEDRKLAMNCMDYTGTLDLADTPVNEVSGGQKQRILLAKVLAQQTPILFLDEPTTGLDMVYQEEIFRFASELAKMGKTILMVIHELNLAAKYCSRLLLAGEGHLLADGVPEEVLTEELLSRAYETEISVARNPLNGNWEITATANEKVREKKKTLLPEICRQQGAV